MRRLSVLFFLFFILFSCFFIQADELRVLEVEVDNLVINPIVSDYIISNLDRAQAENYDVFYVTLDTPGGLLESTRDIVKEFLNSSVPVVVHVRPDGARAASAGVFITMSAHVAAMASRTNIGAATPVQMGGAGMPDFVEDLMEGEENEEDEMPAEDPMFDKITEDTKAWARNIAAERGRNEEWIIDAIVEASSITATEALEKNVIDYIARDRSDLFSQIEEKKIALPQDEEFILTTKDRTVVEDKASFDGRYRILYYLSTPQIAFFLLILGFYGLVFEITNPGVGLPGIAGSIFLVLAFLAFQNIPINYAGVILIGLGIILLIAEFYTASFGLFTLGSVTSLAIGSLILIESPHEFMQLSLYVIIPVLVFHILIAVLLMSLAVRAFKSKKHTGAESFEGMEGEAREEISPGDKGLIFTHGENWSAVNCGEETIYAGDTIEVVDKEEGRLILKVKKKHN